MLTEEKSLELADVTLYYRLCQTSSNNSNSSDSKPLTVFLHGWAGAQTDWDFLSREDYAFNQNALYYDAAGFGRSQFKSGHSKCADFSLERYVQDLKSLLDAENLAKVRLVGHSWGGVVAMEFAARYPERVLNLVAIGSAYFDSTNLLHQIFKWVSYLIGWLLVWSKSLLRKSAKLRQQAARRYFCRQPDPARLEHLMNAILVSDNRALIQTLLSGYAVRFKQICPAIKCPALYIGCDKDVVAPYIYVKPFAALTPQGQARLIMQCGHFPMLECPNELAQILQAALV